MHKVFLILMAGAILLGCCSLAYIWSRFRRFEWMPQEKRKRSLIALLPAGGLLLWWILSLDGLVVITHFALIWLICDAGTVLLRQNKRRHYYAGYLAFAITVLYLGYGYLACHSVKETRYTLTTHKALGREHLRIALLSDSHLGANIDGKKMAEYLTEIKSRNPDFLVLAGDLVDGGTKRSDWKYAVNAFSRFRAPLGKYFVFGNHDKGYYRTRHFSADELVRDLEQAGVRVLRDEIIPLTEHIELIGRRDRSDRTRKSAAVLLASGNPACYRILLDHQPNDFAAEEAAGADLVLSGHTHGGQLWPLGVLIRYTARNHVYGLLRRNRTDFIISSGISNWSISFKTGCIAEFVIIDIFPEKR